MKEKIYPFKLVRGLVITMLAVQLMLGGLIPVKASAPQSGVVAWRVNSHGESSVPADLTNFEADLPSADDFVITVGIADYSDGAFTIPTYPGETYNYNVDCDNDGWDEATAQTGDYTCSYASPGIYTMRIKDNTGAGTGFPRLDLRYTGDRPNLLAIEQWGTGHWTSMSYAFYGANSLVEDATDAPDLSSVTDMSYMFLGARVFNGDIGDWDTSAVTNMKAMFYEARAFNQDIGGWNTGAVTDMSLMFYNARAFNQDIGSWNTGAVTKMGAMFYEAFAFNQNIGSWNTGAVTDMSYMFYKASSFNGNIASWNTGAVTDMSYMFYNAASFNGNIASWDTGAVGDMGSMFSGAGAFNQDIGGWNTGAVGDMGSMFSGASTFNQNIGNWDTSAVHDMRAMFSRASVFNQDIGGWDTGAATDMSFMFFDAASFNGNIGSWNTGAVTNMGSMFHSASSFNQNIGSWNTGAVTDMNAMFYEASAFNQDLGGWNTGAVTDMRMMFYGASAFNQDIGGWDTGAVGDMAGMFWEASSFNQDLGGWDVGALFFAATMFENTPLSTANYDALLIGWDAQVLLSGVRFDAVNIPYCTGEAARTNMIGSDGWRITDGGKACSTYTITASAGTGGSIGPSGAVSVNHGADQTFIITPDTDYQVTDVLVDGLSVGAVTSYAFTSVTADHSIAASFAAATPPVITPIISGTLGANGWYTSDVLLIWSVFDAESVVSNTSGCETVSIIQDQVATDYTCSAASDGGTASLTVSIARDATRPATTVTGVSEGATYNLGSVPQAGCATTDNLSGVATEATLAVTGDAPGVGDITATCSGALDSAGNAAGPAVVHYTVVNPIPGTYNFTGFFQPVDNPGEGPSYVFNSVKAGSAVPVRFSLAGDQGLNILADGYPTSRSASCTTAAITDPIEQTVTAGNSSLSYDAASDTYTYIWKTEKGWTGTCRVLIVQLDDGTQHGAYFQFK